MQWLETEFLGYLKKWEKAVEEREGYTAHEKKNMLLSSETVAGFKLTHVHVYIVVCIANANIIFIAVKSIIELTHYILSLQGAPPLLSR